MEDAVEALKMFLAVFIFSLALTVLFRMTSLAKDASDMVFAAIDKTTYIDYDADIVDGANRTVSFGEIMPTIYRYAQEGYGVTIIDEGEIVARFDLDTESQVANCFWNSDRYSNASIGSKRKSNSIKYEISKYLNENILNKVNGTDKFDLPDENGKETHSEYEKLDDVIKSIYGTENGDVFTSWLTGNTYHNSDIAKRINSDIYGGDVEFTTGKHKAVNNGKGLLAKYNKDKKFTEYIVQIDNQNEYIKDEDGNDTDLLVFGTIRYTKKREIIYVVKP